MRKACLSLSVLLAAAGLAEAQEALPRMGGQEVVVHDHEHRFEVTLGLYGRVSGIDGELDPDVPSDYSDLFGVGGGYVLEASFLWGIEEHWKAGPYLSIGGDRYEGRKDTVFVGNSLEADDLDITTVLVGFRSYFPFAPSWYGEAHGALGIATYHQVNGALESGGVFTREVIFEETSVLALDFGGRIGFQADHFFAEAGFGVRVQGAPDTGTVILDPSSAAEFAFEFGAGIRF